jgi:UDP-N-acetyl-2-amino-2-deoxyglucuronate dehydrogenase
MKCAMIGLGMVSGTYAQAILNSADITLDLVHSRTSDSRDAFVQQWPNLGARTANDIDEIIASDADFVIVTTPPNTRLDIVKSLARAGKPILMEKPVERNLQNARDLVEICAQNDVRLGIILQHRVRPVVDQLRLLLDDLGDMHVVEVSVPWWRDQTYYDTPGRGTYARDGGGVMISQAIHTLDLMLSLTGPVETVSALAATSKSHDMEAEDFVSAGLRFASGAVGHVFATTSAYPGRGETITLHCAKGSVTLDAGTLEIEWRDGRNQTLGQTATSGAGADPMAFTSDWHQCVIEDFARSHAENRPCLVTGEEALKVHALIDALERSSKSGIICTVEAV